MFNQAVISSILLVLTASAFAAPAVEAPHYEVSATAVRSDYPFDIDIKSYGLSGSVTLPLAKTFGAALHGGYVDNKFNVPEGSCSTSVQQWGGGIFARITTTGRIGWDYSHNNGDSCSVPGGTLGFSSSNNHTVYGEYYFNAVTLGLRRTKVDGERDDDRNTGNADVAWYATPNTGLHFSAGMLDAKDFYQTFVEFQPALFENSIALRLGYAKRSDYKALMFGVSYFFDKRIALRNRDRQYR